MWGIFIGKLPDIILGFMIPLMIYLFKSLIWDRVQTALFIKSTAFRLDGVWYAKHGAFYNSELEIIEFLSIKQKSERFTLTIEQYRSDRKKPVVYFGGGTIKANNISLYYASKRKDSKQTGVMTLEVKDIHSIDTYLSGCYYEICEGKEEYDFTNYPSDYYKAYALTLTRTLKMKSLLRRKLFDDYAAASACISKVKP